MANVRKKISELTALTSASLDTVVVGVDNGTTYKIELDVLADGVANRINTIDIQRLNNLESVTSSYETKGRSVISSSAQISSLGFVSSSTDITLLNTFTASQQSLNTAFNNGIASRLTTSSFESFSSSVHSEIIAATNEQSFNGLISGSSQLTSSYDTRYVISGSITQTTWDNISGKPNGLVSQSTDLSSLNNFTASFSTASLVNRLNTIESATSSYEITGRGIISSSAQLPTGLVSGSSQLTSSYDTRYTLSGSVQPLPNGLVSSSVQVLGGTGIISSSAQIDTLFNIDGLISASSQLTSSFDTRYALSGSGGSIPGGTVSGSSQLTQSLDGRYELQGRSVVSGSSQLTSSYDVRYTLTSSFNAFTSSAQAVTTGSNSFNGTQIITGSLIITTGSFVGSQITANTSSLYLTSGSNLYVQNNAVVEITGSLVVSGSTNLIVNNLLVGAGSGDEGGEIQLAIPQTNTTLTNKVIVDVYRDKLRLWQGDANSRGVSIDLSKAPAGVGGELIWKVSDFVAAGTFVSLDNLKCTVTTSGTRGLSIGAVSTTFEADASGWYTVSGGSGGSTANNLTYTTTAAGSFGNWNFPTHGDMVQVNLRDKTNNRFYRITMMIGAGYISNFISIERLY